MKNSLNRMVGLAALLALPAAGFAQQAPDDVPATHWAYPAVQDLISKGLIQNFPNGKYLGERTLTRYEMASLVKRMLDYLAKTQVKVIEAPKVNPPKVAAPKPTTPKAPTATKAEVDALKLSVDALKEVQLSSDEVAELRKLIKEFLPELLVMNTNFKALQDKFDALDTKMVDFEQDIKDMKILGAAHQAQLNILNAKKADGYIQARYSRRGTEDPLRAPENVAQDTTRGNGGDRDTFHVRRARLNFRGDLVNAQGQPTRGGYRIQLDARTAPTAGAQELTVKEAYVIVKNFPFQLKNPGVTPWFQADMWLGQGVTPFGHYLPYSSSDRSAPERYIAFSDAGPGLFVNQDYDKGASLKGKLFNAYEFHMGLFNGNGVVSNDLGRKKDFIGQIGKQVTPGWRVGVSAYDGDGSTFGTEVAANGYIGLVGTETPTTASDGTKLNASNNPVVLSTRERRRHLFGFDTQYAVGSSSELKFEYVKGHGGQVGSNQTVVPKEFYAYVDNAEVEGWYVEMNRHFGTVVVEPGKPTLPKLKVVTAYEYYNRNANPAKTGAFSQINLGTAAAPNIQGVSKSMFEESRIHAGLLYQVDAVTRLRLWYEDPIHNPALPGKPDFQNHTPFYTFEVQVKF
ncbi:S-layer homology domain-containing protein [Armatimonas rosea]|uniref:SLH domain-containing protein n=1 Tax=Armatimonas rosea TaxID=685828 RepID=A0A7W9W918_ARMRO|nr:S-layer homology domain-containing protein [Armatimonas rosea]MBB6052172.1 hypothetical protein [Armatimonas rosea]